MTTQKTPTFFMSDKALPDLIFNDYDMEDAVEWEREKADSPWAKTKSDLKKQNTRNKKLKRALRGH